MDNNPSCGEITDEWELGPGRIGVQIRINWDGPMTDEARAAIAHLSEAARAVHEQQLKACELAEAASADLRER